MKNVLSKIVILFVAILLGGCGNVDIGNIKEKFIGEEIYPTIKNEQLGVELPANAITDWKIDDQGWKKYVIYYIDPYKRAHSYVPEVSADIEEVICVDDDIKANEYKDVFEGTWITGLNETDGSYWYTDLQKANEVNISKTQSVGIIELEKIYGTDEYRFHFENFIMHDGSRATIEELKRRNFSAESIVWNRRQTDAPENNAGVVDLADGAECKIVGNKMTIKGRTVNSNYPTWLEIELEYNESSNTLVVNRLDFKTDDEDLRKLVYLNFFKRDHKDILKRYQLNRSPFKNALVQIRMDQLVNNYPELKEEWDKQRVRYIHYAFIPGSEKTTSGWPEYPKMPE